MLPTSLKKLALFQAVNLVASVLVYVVKPASLFGSVFVFQLFSVKIIALLYFNDYPQKKDKYSFVFLHWPALRRHCFFLQGRFLSTLSCFLSFELNGSFVPHCGPARYSDTPK